MYAFDNVDNLDDPLVMYTTVSFRILYYSSVGRAMDYQSEDPGIASP